MTAPARSRRVDILAAAEREFAAAGFSGGRVERIAAAAGVNKQLLFHYFDSKEGLFLTALEALLARSEPRVSGSDQPAEEIRGILATIQSAVRTLPGLLGIIADSAANGDFPLAAAHLVRRWRSKLFDRLREAIAEGQRRGYFRDDADPDALAGIGLAAALGAGALDCAGDSLPIGNLLTDYCAWR